MLNIYEDRSTSSSTQVNGYTYNIAIIGQVMLHDEECTANANIDYHAMGNCVIQGDGKHG